MLLLVQCNNRTVENERLPTELGWSKQVDEVSLTDILRIQGIVQNATSLITDSEAAQSHVRRDLHAPYGA